MCVNRSISLVVTDMFGFRGGRGGFNMGFNRGGMMNMPPRFMRRGGPHMHHNNPYMGMAPMGGRGMR